MKKIIIVVLILIGFSESASASKVYPSNSIIKIDNNFKTQEACIPIEIPIYLSCGETFILTANV